MMYGFIEGQFKESVDSLNTKIDALISYVRKDVGDPSLPVILGRYEQYCEKLKCPAYHKWDEKIIAQINSMPAIVKNLALTPFTPIPSEYYCDDHHYNALGYLVWAWDAVTKIQMNHFDFWYKK